ncbi:bromodomain-containing protein 3 [Phoenix dactylifera]|uniref:Bromodomain-containing protein 3 n=1 Tax=Phoenix dactylifera TaxID=42345 RepID=A0A8B7CNH9_PHODC|nr:bromodomain-containing protein 3 [Phoenix dactylifera]
MEKRVLKIKLKALGTRIATDSAPDRGTSGLLLQDAAFTGLASSSEENIPTNYRKDMKRKRRPRAGHKKGKKKSLVNNPTLSPVRVNTEDDILNQADDGQLNSEMDNESPSLGSDKLSTMSSIGADMPNDKSTGKTGPSRVKVKLRSSRVLEPHRSYSDAQTPSNTDKSNPRVALEKEDSTYSDGQTSEKQNAVSEQLPRKSGSIKIKSSRGLGLSNEIMPDKNVNKLNGPQILGQRNLVLADDEKHVGPSMPRNLKQGEITLPSRDPRYKAKELNAALVVIKKVMKMEAAVPFNAPVNPDALGIPDYFDIIDTPMDFGTICHELERGHKYLNSEDVYKDVQYIWENCYKYNNKGDYILDLMKRVKKNFMKYWLAAGLYSDMPSSGATESTQIEDVTCSGQEKLHPKSKTKHKRRRYGIDRHKSDCLCAVCVVRRRRKEREESSAVLESQMAISNPNLPQEFRIEEASPVDNPCSEDATSSLDRSPETDANVDMEDVENELTIETPELMDIQEKETVESEMELDHDPSGRTGPHHSLPIENGTEDSNPLSQEEMEATQPGDQTVDTVVRQKEAAVAHHHPEEAQKKPGEPSVRNQLIKMQENIVQEENHSILWLCRSLFPSNVRSAWNGPHSLTRRHVSVRDSPIHAALATFMKP